MLRILLSVLLLSSVVTTASEPTKPELATAEAKLKAFHAATTKPSGSTVAASLDDAKVSYSKQVESLNKTDDKLFGLQTAAANLGKAASDKDTKKREAEAERFMGILKTAKPNSHITEVEKLARELATAKFMIVAESPM